jgi:predicted GNAT superfamily acetyltransferase
MIEIRPLTAHAEFQEAVKLQQQIWGFEEIELLPLRLFVVASKVGGQVFGAYDGPRMIGFCLAIPGLKPGGLKAGGKSYLHSHMLGVLPEYRDAGVGRRVKLAQRDDALSRGIDLIEWTFDPLEIKNAFFNTERLGAIVRRYVFNQYGTTTSHLHGGLPTDRCIAEWWIASPRAKAIVAGQPFNRNPVEVRIAIPAEIAAVREDDPKRAREIQQQASTEFQAAFDRGLAVIGFEKSNQAGTYLLGKWESSSIESH